MLATILSLLVTITIVLLLSVSQKHSVTGAKLKADFCLLVNVQLPLRTYYANGLSHCTVCVWSIVYAQKTTILNKGFIESIWTYWVYRNSEKNGKQKLGKIIILTQRCFENVYQTRFLCTQI